MEEKKKKRDNGWKTKYLYATIAGTVAIACSVLFIYVIFRNKELTRGISTLVNIVRPFIIGCALAYILRPVCNVVEHSLMKAIDKFACKHKLVGLVQSVSVLSSLLVAALVIYILSALVLPQIVISVISITQRIPSYISQVSAWGEEMFAANPLIMNWVETLSEDVVEKFQGWARTDLIPQLANMVGGVSIGVRNMLSFVFNILIGVIVSIYLLRSRQKLAAQSELVLYSICSKKWADRILAEIKFADKMFSGFISGKLLDSAIIGVVCFIVLSIMHTPYVMLVSVIVGVTNIIPFFGPYIGAFPSAFIILTADPMKAVYFLIFIIILQQIDGNIIGPKILGGSTGLSSFWVLFSITFFGGLFGFVGMLIGVPVFAVLYDIVKQMINWGLHRHDNLDKLEVYKSNFPEDERKTMKKNKKSSE